MDIEYFKHNILPLKNKLFRKALSITESVTESQDIVQEVMMRLWDRRVEWKAISNIEVYSMVLTKNMALDKIKKHGFYSQSIESIQEEHIPSSAHNPNDKIEKAEQIALVWKIINLLPKQYQELVKLREIEELSYDEIAKTLNITESQVKMTLFRARQKMKTIYLKISTQNGY